jgi:hypothetical protein
MGEQGFATERHAKSNIPLSRSFGLLPIPLETEVTHMKRWMKLAIIALGISIPAAAYASEKLSSGCSCPDCHCPDCDC